MPLVWLRDMEIPHILRSPANIRKYRPNLGQLQILLLSHPLNLRVAWGQVHGLLGKADGEAFRFRRLLIFYEIVTNRKAAGDASGVLALCDYGPQLCVLRLLVAAEVDLALEGPAAEVAGERLETSVFSGVGDEVRGLAEGLAADRAFVWFFT